VQCVGSAAASAVQEVVRIVYEDIRSVPGSIGYAVLDVVLDSLVVSNIEVETLACREREGGGVPDDDVVALCRGVAAVDVRGGQADVVLADRREGVDRVLFGRVRPVAEVPGPRCRQAERFIGELHGEREFTLRPVGGESGYGGPVLDDGNRVRNRRHVAPAVVCGGQADGEVAAGIVGVDRVLLGRMSSVAEVPEPIGDVVAGRGVGERNGKRRPPGGDVGRERRDRRVLRRDVDIICLDGAVGPGVVRRRQGDGVDAGGFIGVRRVLYGCVRTVAEVPVPALYGPA